MLEATTDYIRPKQDVRLGEIFCSVERTKFELSIRERSSVKLYRVANTIFARGTQAQKAYAAAFFDGWGDGRKVPPTYADGV